MAANLEQITEDLSNLTVLEAAELSKMLEEKWGVSAAAPVAVAAAGGADAGAAAEEKTEFDVILTGAGDKKIKITISLCIKEYSTHILSPPECIQILLFGRGEPTHAITKIDCTRLTGRSTNKNILIAISINISPGHPRTKPGQAMGKERLTCIVIKFIFFMNKWQGTTIR